MIVRNSANSTSVKPVPHGLTALTCEAAFQNDHKYSRGAQIFWEGKSAEYIYQIKDGAVRSYKLLSDGRRQICAFYLPGDIFGVETDDLHRFTAEAITDTTVWIAKRHGMFEGRDNDLASTKNAFELLLQDLQRAQNQLLDYDRVPLFQSSARLGRIWTRTGYRCRTSASKISTRLRSSNYLEVSVTRTYPT